MARRDHGALETVGWGPFALFGERDRLREADVRRLEELERRWKSKSRAQDRSLRTGELPETVEFDRATPSQDRKIEPAGGHVSERLSGQGVRSVTASSRVEDGRGGDDSADSVISTPSRDRHGASPTSIGYRSSTASTAAGVTIHQLDNWARAGLVTPSVPGPGGSDSQSLYGFRDVVVLRVVKRLLDTGAPLENIHSAVNFVRSRLNVEDLTQITLMTDGNSVYRCSSPDEVVSLVREGRGVFAVAVDRVWREVAEALASQGPEGVTVDVDLGSPLTNGGDDAAPRGHAVA